MLNKKIIMWFRWDLRLADNPALHAAVSIGKIIPVYILDEHDAGDFKMGSASRWWLHHSLKALSESLDGMLRVYQGDALHLLEQIFQETQADAVYWNRCYEPWEIIRDTKIKSKLMAQGYEVQDFNGSLLWDPREAVKADRAPYKVFTAFFKNQYMKSSAPRQPVSVPHKIEFIKNKNRTSINDLCLLSDKLSLDYLGQYWTPSEKNAMKRFKYFLEHKLFDYKSGRNFPAQESVSRLSPHLRFGEISPNQIWSAIQTFGYDFATGENIQCYIKELVWREFTYNVLFYNPTMVRECLDKKFERFAWQHSLVDLQAWQMGMTGYPIIDAAMRELYNTGYMHNRMRMVVASFLIKNLMIHWHHGADWFWEMLVDADLANNSFNWQWVAGCGYDAAPYFRIFNPVTQGKKFDAQGLYTRKWVPELDRLSDKYLFEPWKAPENVLQAAGIILGKTYPYPIVDIAASRVRALATYKKL